MDINQTIMDNMGLVYKQLHRFNLANNDDAFSAAMEALWSAAKTFDASKSIQFSTYATVCIYNALAVYKRQQNKVRQLDVLSYDAALQSDNPTRSTFLDLLASANLVEDSVERKELWMVIDKAFTRVINETDSKASQIIVRSWYESGCKMRQQDLAKLAGVTQSHASRALSAAKCRLRKELSEYLWTE